MWPGGFIRSYRPRLSIRARKQRLLQAIAKDGDTISRQGERRRNRRAMVLQSLYLAFARKRIGKTMRRSRAALKARFQQVEKPSVYKRAKFSAPMRDVSEVFY